jgi:hypothetical protein
MSTTRPAAAPVLPDLRPEVAERPSTGDGDGDHDRFTHYVARRDLERFQRTGRPVTALCGKRWKPDADPSRFPMCPTCAEIAAERLAGGLG